MINVRTIICFLIVLGSAAQLRAQSPAQLENFHDQATALIEQMATRALTPGDTLLTFNPEPGGLIHTVHVSPTLVESSLLRADQMMGTAHVEWAGARIGLFAILWTRADTLHGTKVDSAIAVRGKVKGDSILIDMPAPHTFALPAIPWGIADFGMEEQLIPIFRSMTPAQPAQPVAVLRPYHLAWDTVMVSTRDSAGLRMAEIVGPEKCHEIWILDQSGQVLYVRRVDQSGDRIPLPMSERYEEMLGKMELIRVLLAPFPAAQPPTQ